MGPIIREAWPRPSRSTGDKQDPSQASGVGAGVPAAGDQAAFSPVGTGGAQGWAPWHVQAARLTGAMPKRRGLGEASTHGAWLAPRTFLVGAGCPYAPVPHPGPTTATLAVKFEL